MLLTVLNPWMVRFLRYSWRPWEARTRNNMLLAIAYKPRVSQRLYPYLLGHADQFGN